MRVVIYIYIYVCICSLLYICAHHFNKLQPCDLGNCYCATVGAICSSLNPDPSISCGPCVGLTHNRHTMDALCLTYKCRTFSFPHGEESCRRGHGPINVFIQNLAPSLRGEMCVCVVSPQLSEGCRAPQKLPGFSETRLVLT